MRWRAIVGSVVYYGKQRRLLHPFVFFPIESSTHVLRGIVESPGRLETFLTRVSDRRNQSSQSRRANCVFLGYFFRPLLPALHIHTHRMRDCLVWGFLLLSIALASPVSPIFQDDAGEYYCGRETYGSPNIVDCHPLLESFANYQDNVLRVFDEEQMRVDGQGSWPGLIGTVGAAHLNGVVQVPRFYTLSM